MRYRRTQLAGGCFFFTLALQNRQLDTLTRYYQELGEAFRAVRERHPFAMPAVVVLPDHLHCIWQLPEGVSDYSTRWSLIKSRFSRQVPAGEPIPPGRKVRGERGIWQRRFWEHCIRDGQDLRRHIDYIHYNPVKHGLVSAAKDWPCSSFHRYVRKGLLDERWGVAEMPDGEFGE